jgi:hypothetical protein
MSNMIDRLIDRLNEIEGIEFVRDAWINDESVTHGVVAMTGEASGCWADGRMVDQAFRLRLAIYVKDGEDGWLDAVQAVLDDEDIAYTLPNRSYLYDADTVEWEWTCTLYGPLEVDDGEDGD